jgi:hypothetical protein
METSRESGQKMDVSGEASPNPAFQTVAGICALLLMAALFGAFYRKFKNDNRADMIAIRSSLYRISVATGRSEYDLFRKSAEGWPVSRKRIHQDFKMYLAHQILPYYTRDFVRKQQRCLDEALVKKEVSQPTRFRDWAKALLVFPGSLVFLLSMCIFMI